MSLVAKDKLVESSKRNTSTYVPDGNILSISRMSPRPRIFGSRPEILWSSIKNGCHVNKTYFAQVINIRNRPDFNILDTENILFSQINKRNNRIVKGFF